MAVRLTLRNALFKVWNVFLCSSHCTLEGIRSHRRCQKLFHFVRSDFKTKRKVLRHDDDVLLILFQRKNSSLVPLRLVRMPVLCDCGKLGGRLGFGDGNVAAIFRSAIELVLCALRIGGRNEQRTIRCVFEKPDLFVRRQLRQNLGS